MKPILVLSLALPAAFLSTASCGGEPGTFSTAGQGSGGKVGSSGRGGSGGTIGGSGATGGAGGRGGTSATGGVESGGQSSAGNAGRAGMSGAAGEGGSRSEGGRAGSLPLPPDGDAGMPGQAGEAGRDDCPAAAPSPMSDCTETRPPLRCNYDAVDCRCRGERWTCESSESDCPAMPPVTGATCERGMGPGGRCRYDDVECECAMDAWRCRERPEAPGAGGAPDGPPGGAGAPDGPGI